MRYPGRASFVEVCYCHESITHAMRGRGAEMILRSWEACHAKDFRKGLHRLVLPWYPCHPCKGRSDRLNSVLVGWDSDGCAVPRINFGQRPARIAAVRISSA